MRKIARGKCGIQKVRERCEIEMKEWENGTHLNILGSKGSERLRTWDPLSQKIFMKTMMTYHKKEK